MSMKTVFSFIGGSKNPQSMTYMRQVSKNKSNLQDLFTKISDSFGGDDVTLSNVYIFLMHKNKKFNKETESKK